jgi:putative transcriptional regulator
MKTTNLTNHFIIAMPSLLDDNFNQTVTYICEHNENGCFGIVINRKTDVTLDEVIHQMDLDHNESIARHHFIYHGGPVQQERGFILHQPLGEWSSSLKINDHLALTTSRDILEAIAHDQGPEQSIIALGYAGWSPGQLEQEIADNTWLNCPAEEQIIFDIPAEKRWQAAADLLGIDLQLLSNDAGHA